jgi:hypothetical protein
MLAFSLVYCTDCKDAIAVRLSLQLRLIVLTALLIIPTSNSMLFSVAYLTIIL